VDELIAAAPLPARGSAECVPAGLPAVSHADGNSCAGGHIYNFFPLGVSILSLPVIFVLQTLTSILSPFVPRSLPLFGNPIIASFFSGDLLQGSPLAELWTASFFGAVAVLLQYRTNLLFLSAQASTWLAALFALGTAEWSVGSRSLGQHGISVLLISTALYLLLRGLKEPRWLQFTAIPLALAFTVRPANAISVVLITLFIVVHRRRYLLRFVAWSLPVALPFFVYNILVRHSLVPLYYRTGPPFSSVWPGLAMQLFSPSRGLLIFTPVFVFSAIGMALAFRRRWIFPLAPYLVAIVALHALVISLWWPGHCYGSRYFTDMIPLFMLFLIPAIAYWQDMKGPLRTAACGVFAAVALWGVFTNARGATSVAANSWSATPVSVDLAPARVWDWKDPQFLRGL